MSSRFRLITLCLQARGEAMAIRDRFAGLDRWMEAVVASTSAHVQNGRLAMERDHASRERGATDHLPGEDIGSSLRLGFEERRLDPVARDRPRGLSALLGRVRPEIEVSGDRWDGRVTAQAPDGDRGRS